MLRFILPQDKDLFKYIFTLAVPVIISNISRVLMGLVDTIMVGHLGAHAIAGVGMASMVTWTVMSLGIAFRTGTQTLVSRRLGQKKYDECGTALRNMHLFVLLIGIPLSYICYLNTQEIMSFFLKDEKTLNLCVDYSLYIFLSIYFIYMSFVFQGFYTGIEKTKIHMKVVLSSNLLNFYLNAGFIFGSNQIEDFLSNSMFSSLSILWIPFKFPELGVQGAAIGTLIATIWGCIYYSFYLFEKQLRNKYNIFKNQFDVEMLKKQLIIAYPLAIQEFLVMLSITMFYKIIAIIGIIEMAATQIIFKIMHASFMPAIGVGQACATLVGKFLGEEKPDKAEVAVKESLRGSLYMMVSVGICFIIFADFIIPLFINDSNVIALAVPGLRFIGLLQAIDAFCFTLWFALTGAGDTKILAIIDILNHWLIFIPLCYFLSIYCGYGYWGAWFSFGVMLTGLAPFLFIRFKIGNWKKIKV
jgi:putative MATE family efflux protein